MPQLRQQVTGQVIDRRTRRGIAGLRVEAWSRDHRPDDLVASAITDAQGAFRMEVDASRFRETHPETPQLYLKVSRGSELIATTEGNIGWDAEGRPVPVVIEVDVADEGEPKPFVVRGRLTNAEGRPLPGVTVRVADRDLRREESLDQSLTDNEGRYEIRYGPEDFARAEKRRADLVVRVFSPRGTLWQESGILFNAAESETVDLTITPREEPKLSQFELLVEAITPVLAGVPVEELNDDDIQFLIGEFAGDEVVNEKRLRILSQGARLARQTALPTEFFYGVASVREEIALPLGLTAFLTLSSENARHAVEQAVERNIVSAKLRDSLDGILARLEALSLEHGVLVRRSVTGRLTNEETSAPLSGYRVRAFDLDAAAEPKALGLGRSDARGLFAVSYTAAADAEGPRRLRLHVVAPDGNEIHQEEITIAPDQDEAIEIRIKVPAVPDPAAVPLAQVTTIANVTIPETLRTFLAEKNIHTLVDIRRAGGLRRLDGLPLAEDDPAVRTLEAHANLTLLSPDVAQNHRLIGKGFPNLLSIANSTRAEFVTALHADLGDFKAAQIHAKATAQTKVLDNVLVGLQAEFANGFPLSLAGITNPAAGEFFNGKCSCEDCEAALSPLAYLADLLDYAGRHLRDGSKPCDLDWLASTLHQPFGDLPISCEAMDKKVRQVRLCIEVLRAHLGSVPLSDAVKEAESAYLLAAYTTLLTKLGTSYEEIRLARTADKKEREALAKRLGIDLDELDGLFLDPNASPAELTEQKLEELFGLADTTREVLSEGVKLGDSQGAQAKITRWNLDNVEWNKDTDVNGTVYLRLEKVGSKYGINLYRDAGRTELVAAGEHDTPTGLVKVAKTGSDLTGTFTINYNTDTSDIEIAAIPRFLSWRLKHLRTLWRDEDHPTDPFNTDVIEDQRPLVDPDIIGPDDISPFDGQVALQLWEDRRKQTDEFLEELKLRHASLGLNQVLQDVLGSPLPPLDKILLDLTEGDKKEVEDAKTKIKDALHLIAESFNRLMGIMAKDGQPEQDQKPSLEEWSEFYSILAQAGKVKKYQSWIQQEKQQGVVLDPTQFWISQREPVEGQWPPDPFLIDPELPPDPLERPLIDPELVAQKGLPDPFTRAGRSALKLWRERRDRLEDIYKHLRHAREGGGFEAMLRLALGEPEPGGLLPVDLSDLQAARKSGDENTFGQAKEKINKYLYMSVESFDRLMELRVKAGQANPSDQPSTEEWAEVYAILTTARKLKHEYPPWKAQEQNPASHVTEYWQALKARLPRWRASPEARQIWQQALRVRSSSPIIDPDVVTEDYLRSDVSVWYAYQLGTGRDLDIKTWLTQLESESQNIDGFAAMLSEFLGIDAKHLDELEEQRDDGIDIRPRLNQLNLTMAAFDRLLGVHKLLTQPTPSPVIEEEWNDVHNILLQARKHRAFGEWHRQEQEYDVLLGPHFFKIPEPSPPKFPPSEPEALPVWRATWRDRRDWEDRLESRLDQVTTTIEAVQTAVSETEEETLPRLRDALIEAVKLKQGTGSFDETAKWVTDKLLIDAKAGGCQLTTRVAQAIETIQGLLWSMRIGQLQDTYPNLVLDADNFEEEWKWIGSYTPWRSAMFVLLYPENILLPNLRKWQTPAFTKLVNDLRGGRRVTPETACEAAKAYSKYFRDVGTLTIEATCQSRTRLHRGNCRDRAEAGESYLFYMFGRGLENRQTVYWSAYDPDAPEPDYAQTFWDPVPGITNVMQIIGAVPYEIGPGNRQIFLFVMTNEKKLVYSRYDLEKQEWESEPSGELETPPDTESWSAVVVEKDTENTPPELGINAFRASKDYTVYIRPLNPDATDWQGAQKENESNQQADDDWSKYSVWTASFNEVLAIRDIRDTSIHRVLFVRTMQDTKILAAVILPGGQTQGVVVAPFPWLWWSPWTGFLAPSDSILIFPPKGSNQQELFILQGSSISTWANVTLVPMTPFMTVNASSVLDKVLLGSGDVPSSRKRCIACQWEGDWFVATSPTVAASLTQPDFLVPLFEGTLASSLLGPRAYGYASVDIIPGKPAGTLQADRRIDVKIAFENNAAAPEAIRTYLREAFYFVPVHLALQLQSAGYYMEALDWFRTVYDYSVEQSWRKTYYGLQEEESLKYVFERTGDWLLDPLNPHAIAASRRYTYTRFTLLLEARCFCDYADEEFTRDTPESVPRARILYMTALDLLDTAELKQMALASCEKLKLTLKIEADPKSKPQAYMLQKMRNRLDKINYESDLKATIGAVNVAFATDEPWDVRFAAARGVLDEAISKQPPPKSMKTRAAEKTKVLAKAHSAILANEAAAEATAAAGALVAKDLLHAVSFASGYDTETLEHENVSIPWLHFSGDAILTGSLGSRSNPGSDDVIDITDRKYRQWLETKKAKGRQMFGPHAPVAVPVYEFCIPPNPVVEGLRLHAELNLYKIRTCRNIAGIERQLDPYAAPTDTLSGMPYIGTDGQLVLPGAVTLQPTPYRYQVLIERAKRLIELAALMESAMLSAIEKYYAEAFQVLKARQDIRLADAGVRLQQLRVREAESRRDLATLQQQRAQIQKDTYEEWINAGLNQYELEMLDAFQAKAAAETAAAFFQAGIETASASPAAASAVATMATAKYMATGLAAEATAQAQTAAVYASFERSKQQWELQKALAEQDIAIAGQEYKIANDNVRVVGQEQKIAEIQADHARDVMEFLANKFTSAELYDWMSNVLERVYGYFLQQATAMAQLGAQQLAFERQEAPPPFIQADYWEAPAETLAAGKTEEGPDRRGLTGSARLLQDIYKLDQYAFETDKRKLQLTKTISLAQLSPVEFQRFRETGVINFATPMELFDRDFPGHYLRLIKRVRSSVIALIPPMEGIHATLSTIGLSSVVIGSNGFYQTVAVKRPPESVALTSPINATGIFELTPQPGEMLLPFEGTGVDANWELRMPKASNQLDYSAIADWLISVEYTALPSFDYRQQVIQQLDTDFSADRPFSFRHEFADAWYDLHNPEQTPTPMVVRFNTQRQDFPPNVDDLKIQQVVLYFARKDGASFEMTETHLHFTPQDGGGTVGGESTSVDGVISTRKGNAGSWTAMIGKSPVGEWELALPNTPIIKDRFKDEQIEDMLFVITYKGQTPAWPA